MRKSSVMQRPVGNGRPKRNEKAMKQFISKVKDLSQKAAEIKAAMQQVPPKSPTIKVALPLASTVEAEVTHVSPAAESSHDPLARFKKMPDLAKLRK